MAPRMGRSGRGSVPVPSHPGGAGQPYEDYHRPIFTVGQVAELLNVQQAFLRRLDQQDLVSPARSEGMQRRYSRHDMDRVGAVCDLVDDGITLAGIRVIFGLKAEIAALKAQIAELEADPA